MSLVPGISWWDSASTQHSTPETTNRSVQVRPARASQARLIDDGDYCSVPPPLLKKLGVEEGHQIRICRATDECATYTVLEDGVGSSPGIIRMSATGRGRLGTSEPFTATVHRPVPHRTVSTWTVNPTRSTGDEFVEVLSDPGDDTLIVSAPHGGAIERYTDEQVRHVAANFETVTTWGCLGWHSSGAFDRWHVDSTAIHPASFPGLASIADRGFAYSVSFHGFTSDGISIGGGVATSLKREVRDAIRDRIGEEIDVRLAVEPEYDGTSPENFVNWLTDDGTNGLQIEQSFRSREEYGRAIAEAVMTAVQSYLN